MGVVVPVPGSPTLLHALFLGAPLCPRGTGDHLTASITGVCDRFISREQYRGLSADGVYKHTHVPEKLDNHYGQRTVFVHDLMHKAALVDTHMRKDKKFTWLVRLTYTIGKAVGFIQWGMEWHHFFEIFTKMVEKKVEERVLRPKTFSDTKMANHAKQVYQRFRQILPAMLQTLREVMEKYTGGDSDEDKQLKANDVFKEIHTVTFLLSLSALVDVYTVYALISNNFQVINQFPFDRKDIFDKHVHSLGEMRKTVGVEACPCSMYFDYRKGIYLRVGCPLYMQGEEEEEEVEVVLGEEEEKKKKEELKLKVKRLEANIAEVCGWQSFHHDVRTIMVTIQTNTIKLNCQTAK